MIQVFYLFLEIARVAVKGYHNYINLLLYDTWYIETMLMPKELDQTDWWSKTN